MRQISPTRSELGFPDINTSIFAFRVSGQSRTTAQNCGALKLHLPLTSFTRFALLGRKAASALVRTEPPVPIYIGIFYSILCALFSKPL
jgi:hypothetical protein